MSFGFEKLPPLPKPFNDLRRLLRNCVTFYWRKTHFTENAIGRMVSRNFFSEEKLPCYTLVETHSWKLILEKISLPLTKGYENAKFKKFFQKSPSMNNFCNFDQLYFQWNVYSTILFWCCWLTITLVIVVGLFRLPWQVFGALRTKLRISTWSVFLQSSSAIWMSALLTLRWFVKRQFVNLIIKRRFGQLLVCQRHSSTSK